MSLSERDFKRAAEAVVAKHGDAAALSVERYIMMLRRENRHDIACYWEHVAGWIEAIRPRSLH